VHTGLQKLLDNVALSCGGRFWRRVRYAPKRHLHNQRKQLELSCKDSLRATTDILQKIFIEFEQYQTHFDEYDAYNERIVNELNKI